MLSRPQIILLKRAQAQAGIEDDEYRQAIEMLTGLPGATTSKDPRLTDRHLDNLLAYFESIYWNRVDRKEVSPPSTLNSHQSTPVFRQRGYWASKNPKENTSRDRFTTEHLDTQITQIESELMTHHQCRPGYFMVIQNKIRPFDKYKYLAALTRTLEAKKKKLEQPF